MKKILFIAVSFLLMSAVQASEIIRVFSPYSPGHSATPAMLRILDQANSLQNIYKFVLEFRPGGNQVIAVKNIDEQSLAVIAPAFVENVDSGKLAENDYVPVWAIGDACWAVITNKSLTGSREFVVGGVGFGNAAHLTALALGQRHGFGVRYIVFKSNNDALVNMAGNNGVEFVIDKYEAFESLRSKNPKLRMVAASCPRRLPQAPNVPTLAETGIKAPYIFNIAVAHRDMPAARRQAIATILDNATRSVGADEIYRLSAMRPPVFDGVSAQNFYQTSVAGVRNLQKQYKSQIQEASR